MLWSLDETALDLFARRPAKGFRTGLRFVDDATSSAATGGDRGARAATGDGFQPRQVIEVCGSSATPKLLVLLHAVAAFLIKRLDDLGDREADSSEHATSTLSSANERVFLFDHEFEADAHQLLHVLLEKLQTRIPDSKQRHVRSLSLCLYIYVYICEFICDEGSDDAYERMDAGRRAQSHGPRRDVQLQRHVPVPRDAQPAPL